MLLESTLLWSGSDIEGLKESLLSVIKQPLKSENG